MSPTREVWKPLRANTRTAASRSRRRFSSATETRSAKVVQGSGRFASDASARATLVVDFTRYLPGAFASSELRRHAARLVREQPGGDPMRQTAANRHDALDAGQESVVSELPAEREFAAALLERAHV